MSTLSKTRHELTATAGIVLNGTPDDDELVGTVEDDILRGLGGDDELRGRQGDDRLVGGGGNDALEGGAGDDTYVFGLGSGSDSIYDTGGGADRIELGEGISTADVTLTNDGYSLFITLNASGKRLEIEGQFDLHATFIEFLEFADGTVWDRETMFNMALHATDGDDGLFGDAANNVINGLGGDDEIYAHRGNDRVNGNTGDDYVFGDRGNDRINGGAGNDRLYGALDDDRMNGGIGDDYLNGGSGNDTYIFGRGDGHDTVNETTGIDRILLDAGITTSDVTLSQYAGALVLTINDTGDQMTVAQYFGDYSGTVVESIEFADGTIWDSDTIYSMSVKITEGADFIYGTHGDNEIHGLGGGDAIYGNGGDDLIDGGAGDDFLYDSVGNDTYLFGLGYGTDRIHDNWGEADSIVLGAGIETSDVTVKRQGSDLILTLNDSGEQVRVTNHFGFESIESIEFDDGTIWNMDDIVANIHATESSDYLMGTSGDDTIDGLGGADVIEGYGANDTLYGGLGNDNLYGNEGNDVLAGGIGEDHHEGGTGDDTYLFNESVVEDSIYDWGGSNDRIVFGSWISADDVTMSREDNTLILTFDTTGERLRVQQHFSGFGEAIEAVEFSDGTVWDGATAAGWF